MNHVINIDLTEKCYMRQMQSDLHEYCEDSGNCEGKKLMTRLMVNFNQLSNIFTKIQMETPRIGFRTKYQKDEYLQAKWIGSKLGEAFRMAIGFSI